MKTLAIAGNAIETRYDVPDGMERWAFNEFAVIHPRWLGAAFQLHPPDVYRDPDNPKDAGHWEWLRQEHEFPIYMQDIDPDVPASVRYPLEEVRAFLGNLAFDGEPIDLFLSSYDYALALALYQGYEMIHIYGVEMRGKYEDMRLGCGLWTGIAMGKGVKIDWHCGWQMWQRKLYGYEEFIRTVPVQWVPFEMAERK